MTTPPPPPELTPLTPAPTPEVTLDRGPVRPRDGGGLGRYLALGLLLAALGLVAITLFGRALRAPPAPLTGLVMFLPYLYGLYAVTAFTAWCLVPDRRDVPALLALGVVGAGLLWGPSWPSFTEQAEGAPVRLMEWNVRRLWGGVGDSGDASACVVQAVRDAEPDVLVLLEVSADDVRALSTALSMRCHHTDYNGTGAASAGGLAVCARGDTWSLRSGRTLRFVDDDPWRYVFAEVQAEEQVLNVLGVHLRPYGISTDELQSSVRSLVHGDAAGLARLERDGRTITKAQGAQSQALLERVSRLSDPTLVVGDFNSTRDAALHTSLRRHLVDIWERGGTGFGGTIHFLDWLPLRIDYAYATDAFAVSGARVLPIDCSDHRPVVANLVQRLD